jgi:hypothetical protein
MGTRNLTMVISKGETKVAQYGQWDGYPSGKGVNILNFLITLGTDKTAKEEFLKERKENGWARDNAKEFLKLKNLSIENFKENLDSISFFAEEEIEILNEDFGKSLKQRPYLSRDVASEILLEISKGNVDKLVSQEKFAGDSLFCEWAYVVDLDKNTFEVYKGFNTKKIDETERFFYLQEEEEEYKPVSLLKSYELNNLPTIEEFLKLEEEKEEVKEEEEEV